MTTLPPESGNPQGADGAGAVPPAQPQYQQPAAPDYQSQQFQAPPAQGGYQQPAPAGQTDPFSNVQLNYWLSVFFTWLPALIFWIIEKDKGNAKALFFHKENLNFSLIRTAVGLVWMIPYIGWIVGGLGGLVLFIFHIMAAVKVKENYEQNAQKLFIFNVPIIK